MASGRQIQMNSVVGVVTDIDTEKRTVEISHKYGPPIVVPLDVLPGKGSRPKLTESWIIHRFYNDEWVLGHYVGLPPSEGGAPDEYADVEDVDGLTEDVDDLSDTVEELAARPGWDIGDIKATARVTPTTGWLMCYGQEVSRTTYAELWAALGSPDTGDSNTTFNLPDLRGRTLIGKDNMGGSGANRITDAQADVLLGTGGAETVTLTSAEMPVHTHVQNSHTHTQDAHTHTADSHTHSVSGTTGSGTATITTSGSTHDHIVGGSSSFFPVIWKSSGGVANFHDDGGTPKHHDISGSGYTAFDGSHTHTDSGHTHSFSATSGAASASSMSNATATNQDATATNQNAGSGGAHANTQPWMAVNYCIKAL